MGYSIETYDLTKKFVRIAKRIYRVFHAMEAVQQSKIGRKRKASRALNPKRSTIFIGVRYELGGRQTQKSPASTSLRSRIHKHSTLRHVKVYTAEFTHVFLMYCLRV